MNFFEQLGIDGGTTTPTIDWEITPAYTFTYFESWGSQRSIRNLSERFYYFYIDNCTPPAKLCLMERGIKFARVVAEIAAPQELLDACVSAQGQTPGLDRSYAIDERVKKWLIANVLDPHDTSLVTPVKSGMEDESRESGLPGKDAPVPELSYVSLNRVPQELVDDEIPSIVLRHNFYDAKINPAGGFENYFVDNGDGLTVTDLVTGLMWQRGGADICSIRQMKEQLEKCNRGKFAGFADWRLPTMEEALSLLTKETNQTGCHLHPCFSSKQPFIFLADGRKPGGYWFADFKQGNIFWASGFNPGGFGRFCRVDQSL